MKFVVSALIMSLPLVASAWAPQTSISTAAPAVTSPPALAFMPEPVKPAAEWVGRRVIVPAGTTAFHFTNDCNIALNTQGHTPYERSVEIKRAVMCYDHLLFLVQINGEHVLVRANDCIY